MHSAIHGDKQQNERDWVLDQFKTGKSPIMVATDVASRGIGMPHPSLPLPSPPPSKLAASSTVRAVLYSCVFRGSLDCVNLPDLVPGWRHYAEYCARSIAVYCHCSWRHYVESWTRSKVI